MKKLLKWGIGLIMIIAIISAVAGNGGDKPATVAADPVASTSASGKDNGKDADKSAVQEEVQDAVEEVSETVAQQNAIAAAESYLDTMPFSRDG